MNNLNKEDLLKIVTMAALNAGIDPALTAAVCAHESNWNTYAARYEPGFAHDYIDPIKDIRIWGLCSVPTERVARATSWGLMQIMGQTAREYLCDLEYLSMLCEPLNGLRWACMKLRRSIDRANTNVTQGLLFYNGGGNSNYPDAVMSHYNDYAYLNPATRRS